MVDSSQEYYNDVEIKYLGLELTDEPTTEISSHFTVIADFIDDALKGEGRFKLKLIS